MFQYVKESSDIFRFDSTFFKRVYLNDENLIRNKNYKTLIELENSILSFGAYSLNNHVTYLEEGIPFIRGINMKNGRIDFSNTIYIDKQANDLLWKSEVKPSTVLLSMSGTIGDVAIASKNWNYPINSNQDIAKIHPNKNISSYYLYVFLLTKYGQNYLKREQRGSVQQHVFLSQIEKFEIPILQNKFISKIEELIIESEDSIEKSKQTYDKAENELLKEIGLQSFTTSKNPVNIKSFKDSFALTGRLDAEYYQLKYEDIENKILNNSNGFTTIANEFEQISLKSKKEKAGFNYIEIGDVNVNDGSCESNYVKTKELPANAKTLVQKGDILISKVRPYRGAVTLINFVKEDLIVSGAFTVLREKETSIFSNEVLKVLLRTKEYKELLLKFNVGTSYPVIKDLDVLNLPIPKISKKVQESITSKIQSSSKLKQQSEHLLVIAKNAVEIAIEKNEVMATEYINNQSNTYG